MNDTPAWNIPADHPVFAGHFPGVPIVPGVMLLDRVLHTLAAATGIAFDQCEISAVKFLSPARPGEALLIQHTASASGTIHFDIVTAHARRTIATGAVAPADQTTNPRGVTA